jgi:quercetin dioxygenase-like cupin family protein
MAAGWPDEDRTMTEREISTELKMFARPGEGQWTATPDGNRRRVLVSTDELMMVEFGFDEGGIGAVHSHPHVQASYVAEGRFEVTIGGRTEIFDAGGSFIVPSNLPHGVRALQAGRLIDSFTPQRIDFLADAKV